MSKLVMLYIVELLGIIYLKYCKQNLLIRLKINVRLLNIVGSVVNKIRIIL